MRETRNDSGTSCKSVIRFISVFLAICAAMWRERDQFSHTVAQTCCTWRRIQSAIFHRVLGLKRMCGIAIIQYLDTQFVRDLLTAVQRRVRHVGSPGGSLQCICVFEEE